MKLLIAYDGSPCSDAAIAALARCGLPPSGEALLLSVDQKAPALWESVYASASISNSGWRPAPIPMGADIHVADSGTNALTVKMLRQFKRLLPDWRIVANFCSGDAKSTIIKEAMTWGADLIVVGSHEKSAFDRMLLGSVSQEVLHNAPCSVRIGRDRHCPPGEPIRLVAGVNGTEGSSAAIQSISSRNWPSGTQIAVVGIVEHVMAPAMGTAALAEGMHVVQRERHRLTYEAVLHAVNQLSSTGLSTNAIICEGEPAQALIREADRAFADCIFIGTRNLGRFGRILLGSVCSAVAAHAHCSVEVVRLHRDE